jgi:hypothetical protein
MKDEKLTPDLAHSIALKALNNPRFTYTYYDEAGWYSYDEARLSRGEVFQARLVQRNTWRATTLIDPTDKTPFIVEVALPDLSGRQGRGVINPGTYDAYAVAPDELLAAVLDRQPLSVEQQKIVRLAVKLLFLSTDDAREVNLCQQMLEDATFAAWVGYQS